MYKVMTVRSCMGTAQAISEVRFDYRFTALKISYLEIMNELGIFGLPLMLARISC